MTQSSNSATFSGVSALVIDWLCEGNRRAVSKRALPAVIIRPERRSVCRIGYIRNLLDSRTGSLQGRPKVMALPARSLIGRISHLIGYIHAALHDVLSPRGRD